MSESIKVPLTRGKFALIDAEDADRVLAFKWHAVPSRSRYRTIWYGKTSAMIDGKKSGMLLHRFVMNAPDGIGIDHKNGDGLDCRKTNLRAATTQQNNCNRTGPILTASGYRNVYQHHQKWHVKIGSNGKTIHLGSFDTALEAAIARDEYAKEHRGEFASLNIPGENVPIETMLRWSHCYEPNLLYVGDAAVINPYSILSSRQLDILKLIACGLRNEQVAERLGISSTTVRTTAEHIYEKLGNRYAAIYALGVADGRGSEESS